MKSLLKFYDAKQNVASRCGEKKLHWIETDLESPMHQFNFYDQDAEVNESIAQASQWFSEQL